MYTFKYAHVYAYEHINFINCMQKHYIHMRIHILHIHLLYTPIQFTY